MGNAEDRYKTSKQIRFKTSILRSDLYDFSDTYIVMKGTITLTKINARDFIDMRNRFLAFKSNAPFTNCISKINNVLTDNAEDLDVVMPMYNLLEYSKNYRKTTGSFWNYYRDERLIILLLIPLLAIILLLLITMQTPSQILSHLNTKAILQEKY